MTVASPWGPRLRKVSAEAECPGYLSLRGPEHVNLYHVVAHANTGQSSVAGLHWHRSVCSVLTPDYLPVLLVWLV